MAVAPGKREKGGLRRRKRRRQKDFNGRPFASRLVMLTIIIFVVNITAPPAYGN
jgi:hypothetical protein